MKKTFQIETKIASHALEKVSKMSFKLSICKRIEYRGPYCCNTSIQM